MLVARLCVCARGKVATIFCLSVSIAAAGWPASSSRQASQRATDTRVDECGNRPSCDDKAQVITLIYLCEHLPASASAIVPAAAAAATSVQFWPAHDLDWPNQQAQAACCHSIRRLDGFSDGKISPETQVQARSRLRRHSSCLSQSAIATTTTTELHASN